MEHFSVLESFFLIFTGAAVLASLALITRQPLLTAYIALGALIGPYGMGLLSARDLIAEIGEVGIIFLLFLIGLDMHPANVVKTVRKATWVVLASSALFAAASYAVVWYFGYSPDEALVIAIAMIFSSTIIGIKLLPTTVLHHRHTGELVVGILLIQDLIAIIVLLMLSETGASGHLLAITLRMLAGLGLLMLLAYLLVRYVLLPLIKRYDRFHEYIFLLAIGWCLGAGVIAEKAGLSMEIGAFVAGVSLATSPISQYIASNLKPLRDFFLILFFFSLGASLNLPLLPEVLLPAILLTALVMVLKPVAFRYLLATVKEPASQGWEVGFRLGQISEFSLLIAYLAKGSSLIGQQAALLIQTTALLTFIFSTYVVIFFFPSPIAIKDALRRD